MKQETLKELAGGLNVLTASTGVGTSLWGFAEYWSFINTNAAGIGVLLTLVFGIVAIAFNLYNSSKLGKVDQNEITIDEHGEKLDQHIQETRDGLEEIKELVKITLTSRNKDDKQ